MNLTGKTLKSKINGNLFTVEQLKQESNGQYYIVRDLQSEKVVAVGKEWFEKGIMQNLEVVEKTISLETLCKGFLWCVGMLIFWALLMYGTEIGLITVY